MQRKVLKLELLKLLLIVSTFIAVMVSYAVSEGSSIAYWTHDGMDVNNEPEVLVAARYAVAPTGVDLNSDESQIISQMVVDLTIDNDVEIEAKIADKPQPVQDEVRLSFRADDVGSLLVNLQKNRNYRVFVKAADAAGNWSAWTVSSDLIDRTQPRPPGKVNCK